MTTDRTGSLAEEAAKLVAALQDWAQQDGRAADPETGRHPSEPPHAHSADAANEACAYCPICAVIRMARATSPEVREHLSAAALSLTLAVKGLLEDQFTPPRQDDPVEKIDLAEDGPDE